MNRIRSPVRGQVLLAASLILPHFRIGADEFIVLNPFAVCEVVDPGVDVAQGRSNVGSVPLLAEVYDMAVVAAASTE